MDKTFLEKLASEAPAPGGGTASAAAGAMGAALLAMVAKLSLKENPAAAAVGREAETLMEASHRLSREDEVAFESVVKAYKLPRNTPEEKAARSSAIEVALKAASRIPLETAETSLKTLQAAEAFLADANKNALSDIGVAALLSHAAADGALLNVLINLGSIKDKRFVEELSGEAEKIQADAKRIGEKIQSEVRQFLLGSLSPR